MLEAYMQSIASLDSKIKKEAGEEQTLGDFISDKTDISNDCIWDYEVEKFMKKVKELLTEKEMEVLEYRFGLNHRDTHTLEETGKIMGASRERIRQIQKNALKKLKRNREISHWRNLIIE